MNNITHTNLTQARKELHDFRHLLKRQALAKEKIAEAEVKVLSARTVYYMASKAYSGRTQLSDWINELLDLKQVYEAEESRVHKLLLLIETKINEVAKLNPLLSNILTLYFIKGYKLEQVALDVGYCYSQTKMYLRRGIVSYSLITFDQVEKINEYNNYALSANTSPK